MKYNLWLKTRFTAVNRLTTANDFAALNAFAAVNGVHPPKIVFASIDAQNVIDLTGKMLCGVLLFSTYTNQE